METELIEDETKVEVTALVGRCFFERWGVAGEEWRELIEDETMVVPMKPPSFGGGGMVEGRI